MSEATDYKRFKDMVLDPLDRLDRIENSMVPGMPDTNLCGEETECWIEFKSPKEPMRASTKLFGSNHKLSLTQRNWFLRQRNAGGKAFVLIVTDKRWILMDGKHADLINEMTIAELLDAALWHHRKPITDKKQWKILRSRLLK